MRAAQYARVFMGILNREAVRWFNQRSRFVSALVRPLVWLGIFAAGFRFTLGLSIIEPYDTYIPYEVYIAPGLVAMIQLFNGMQSSLSMVYDREMGSMKTLMISPFPRWYLLLCKLAAGVAVSIVQVYMFLAVVWLGDVLNFWDVGLPWLGYLEMLPAMILAGLMLGALGLVLSSFIKQLENFAGVMNFVIFPMFFASSALNPLWRVKESSLWLYRIYSANPFTHAVELIRFSMYGKFNALSAAVVAVSLLIFMTAAVWGYDPGRGLIAKRGGPPE
jgi:ABC-2 type transport system permease protein